MVEQYTECSYDQCIVRGANEPHSGHNDDKLYVCGLYGHSCTDNQCITCSDYGSGYSSGRSYDHVVKCDTRRSMVKQLSVLCDSRRNHGCGYGRISMVSNDQVHTAIWLFYTEADNSNGIPYGTGHRRGRHISWLQLVSESGNGCVYGRDNYRRHVCSEHGRWSRGDASGSNRYKHTYRDAGECSIRHIHV